MPQHKHSSWSDEEYADDYGYGDYSSDVDDGEYLNENEKVVHTVPEFVTDPIVDTVNEGDTFKLPCFVEKLGKVFRSVLASNLLENLAAGTNPFT